MNVAVECVSFDRGESGFSDQFDERLAGEILTGVGAGGMSNSFLNDRTVEIISPEIERKLGDFQAEHYPESLYVEEIVEEKP